MVWGRNLFFYICIFDCPNATPTGETISSSLNGLGTPVKNQMAHVWVYIWAVSSIPLVHMSLHVSALHCFDYCSSVVNVEIRKCESFNLLFSKIILAVWGPLKFPMNLRISFPFLQKWPWNFEKDCFRSIDCLK